jgi:predicted negative regulator of RcsB-dependent stress response
MLTGCQLVTTTSKPVSPAIENYNRGVVLLNEGKYEESKVELDKAVQLDPGYASAYLARGVVYFKTGRIDLAIADYTRVIELDPKNNPAYLNRALAYSEKGQNDLALADYTKAIEIDPKYAKAYLNRGVIYHNNGQSDLAIADYNKALQLTADTDLIQTAKKNLAILGQTSATTTTLKQTPPFIGLKPDAITLTIDNQGIFIESYILVEKSGAVSYRVRPFTLQAHGGSPLAHYTWSNHSMGRNPPFGTAVDQMGVFKGTGSALNEGTYTFDIDVSDGTRIATAAYNVKVIKWPLYYADGMPKPPPPMGEFKQPQTFPDVTIPLVDGIAGQPYAASLLVYGGQPPYSWFADSRDQNTFGLSGLTVDIAGGIVRGTLSPTLSGQTLKFRVVVRDSAGVTARPGQTDTVYTIKVK